MRAASTIVAASIGYGTKASMLETTPNTLKLTVDKYDVPTITYLVQTGGGATGWNGCETIMLGVLSNPDVAHSRHVYFIDKYCQVLVHYENTNGKEPITGRVATVKV